MKTVSFHAVQNYGIARSALKPEANGINSKPATQLSKQENAAFNAVHELAGTLARGEAAASNFVTAGADPHSVVEALAAAELAVETAVTVRDKVVEAYQELIRMPI